MRVLTHRSLAIGLILFFGFFSIQAWPLESAQNAKVTAKKVNINTASSEELQTIPRVGPKVAQRIIDFRTENGPFQRVEDIMKVRGIGEKTFQMIKDLITVDDVLSSAVFAAGKEKNPLNKAGRPGQDGC